MNLTEYADQHLGTTGGGQDLGPSGRLFAAATGLDEGRVWSLLASRLWALADDYDDDPSAAGPAGSRLRGQLLAFGASDLVVDPDARVPMLVVPHADGDRHDLLVFDPGLSEGEPPIAVAVDMDFLTAGRGFAGERWWPEPSNWRQRLATSAGWTGVLDRAVREAATSRQYSALIAPMPEFVPLSGSAPGCLTVSTEGATSPIGTVGVVATDGNARGVVTTARHVTAAREAVLVNGCRVEVLADDPVVDCSILAAPGQLPEAAPRLGPVLTVSPRAHEQARFTGASSGPATTVVRAFDHTLVNPGQLTAVRVYTDADTRAGDSGAALFDGDGFLMGFCCERTAYGATVECTSWIWAQQVVTMMGLTPWSNA